MAKGKVTIDENYCKGCELCVSVCPGEEELVNTLAPAAAAPYTILIAANSLSA